MSSAALILIASCTPEADNKTPDTSPLIGGEQAGDDDFRSVMLIEGVPVPARCTATRIGPRHILTAAHCVVGTGNDGFYETFRSGGQIAFTTAKVANDSASWNVAKIEQIHLPPAWCSDLSCGWFAQDLAVIEVDSLPSAIWTAAINPDTMKPGTSVKIMGYGCEEQPTPNQDSNSTARLKVADTTAKAPTDHGEEYAASYYWTPAADAEVCPGDSGAPVMKNGQVVGVASHHAAGVYSGFARVDRDSAGNMAAWLRSVGAEVVGGGGLGTTSEGSVSSCPTVASCDQLTPTEQEPEGSGGGGAGGSGGSAGSSTGGFGGASTGSCMGYCGYSVAVPGSSPECYCDE